MVKRYRFEGPLESFSGECEIVELAQGGYVLYEDYQALQAALNEALNGWGGWAEKGLWGKAFPNRIAELRKQFLDI